MSAGSENCPVAELGAGALDWVIMDDWDGEGGWSSRCTVVMSWMLDRLLSLPPPELSLMKYFCAWLATCVGVLVCTKLREMFLQSPLPYFFRPRRNNLARRTEHMISFSNY